MIPWLNIGKAPWIRFILITGAFLVFIPQIRAQYRFDSTCQLAYEAVLSLRFAEARNLILRERKVDPGNLVPVYLENYLDFLTLIIGEEKNEYDLLKEKKTARLKLLEKGSVDSPFHDFFLAEINLQWAMVRIKFGDFTAAAFEIRQSHALFSANASRYPTFIINNIGLGTIHVMADLIPSNYKWLSNLLGIDGSIDRGISEIRQVTGYTGPDRIFSMYKPQASFLLTFLLLNLHKDKREAMPFADYIKRQAQDSPLWTSPLLVFARASILMKNGHNDEALTILQERQDFPGSFRFCYLDYLEGMARLNKLDGTAALYFKRYLADFRGQNYIRSAYQKLAWIAILNGDSVGYRQLISQMMKHGKALADEDKQTHLEEADGEVPNVVLLRSRLLFDGGYYDLSLRELLNNPVKTTIRSKHDLVEYTYRLGRIYHETGIHARAIEYYRQTILRGKSESWYFAAGAAYQLGLIYENQLNYERADSAYRLCLSIKTREYKTSLDQKARAGIERIKK